MINMHTKFEVSSWSFPEIS